jgi:hypothetical protein
VSTPATAESADRRVLEESPDSAGEEALDAADGFAFGYLRRRDARCGRPRTAGSIAGRRIRYRRFEAARYVLPIVPASGAAGGLGGTGTNDGPHLAFGGVAAAGDEPE